MLLNRGEKGMRLVTVSGLVAMSVFLPQAFCQENLPSELRHLGEIQSDEAALVAAARRFHQTQIELMSWDRQVAERHSHSETGVSGVKAADMQKRSALLKATWEYVLSLYPQNAVANNYYGEYLYDYGGGGLEALRRWRLATQYDSRYAHPYNNLGLHYCHVGQLERGLDNLDQALKLEPNNPDFLYNLSQMYLIYFPQVSERLKISRDRLFKRAMDMSRKATELAPDDFDLAQDYANNFYAAEQHGVTADWVSAAAAWKRAQPLARTDEERFYATLNEARTWLRANRTSEALAALERARVIRPDSEAVATLFERAESGSDGVL
jgi:tetratricopeptide (TPR) repeat protein